MSNLYNPKLIEALEKQIKEETIVLNELIKKRDKQQEIVRSIENRIAELNAKKEKNVKTDNDR